MKIGDRCFVHGYVDEIRKDTIIVRNKGGYFGTDPGDVITVYDTTHPNWIPCSERLPEVGKEILFCDIDGDIYVGHRAIEHWWSVDDKVKNVTAWMPLPEPYGGEQDE